MSPGKFITLEGGEGVGKSTQLNALAEELRRRHIQVLVTREPGGSPSAESIRELLLRGDHEQWGARAEALLFAAARADHVETIIRPALERGEWVLSDRFVDSSLAYQGGAGGLGIETVREINAFAVNGCYPDRTFVLLVSEGRERARNRDGGASDRIDRRSDDYHRKVEAAFRIIAAEEPERVELVDASGTADQVTQRLVHAIRPLLP